MKKVLLLFCFLSKSFFAQEITTEHRRVLETDSGKIFEKKFSALEFGESYFMFLNEYGIDFSSQEFNDLKLKAEGIHSDIKIFKSSDNKKIMCVFPKSASKIVSSFEGFLNSNFDSACKTSLSLRKTVFIEVRGSYDPLDANINKGFN